MPIVPGAPQQISTDVPGYGLAGSSPSSAGTVGEALSQFGARTNAASRTVMNELLMADAVDAVTKQQQIRAKESIQQSAILKKSAPGGFIVDEDGKERLDAKGNRITLSQAYKEWANQKYKEDQDAMPSGLAQDMYRQNLGSYFSGEVNKLQAEELVLQVTASKRNTMDFIDRAHNDQVEHPSVDLLYDNYGWISSDLKAKHAYVDEQGQARGLFSSEETKQLKKYLIDSSEEGHFLGRKNQIEEAAPSKQLGLINQALAFYRGEDQRSKERRKNGFEAYADIMSEGVKGRRISELLRMRKHAKDKAFSEINDVFNDAKRGRLEGRPANSVLSDIMREREASADTPEELKHYREQHSRMNHDLVVHETVGTISRNMRKAPASKWSGMMNSYEATLDEQIKNESATNKDLIMAADSDFGRADRAQGRAMLEVQMSRIMAEREADSAAYIHKEYPGIAAALKAAGNNPRAVSEALDRVLQKQRELEIPIQHVRLVPKQTLINEVQKLNTKDGSGLATSETALSRKYGDKWGIVLEHMVKDGILSGDKDDIALLAQMKDPMAKTQVAIKSINAKEIKESYETSFDPASRKLHEMAVTQEIGDFLDSIKAISQDGASTGFANRYRKAVTREFQNIMNLNPSMDASEAAKRARSILKDYQEVVAANSKFIVPSVVGNTVIDGRITRAYADSHRKKEALAGMNIAIPKAMTAQPDYAKMTPEQQKEIYFRHIQNRGFWANDKDMFGIKLYTKNPDNTTTVVTHPDGSPVFIRFEDMVKNQDRFTSEELKPGFFRRIFGGAVEAGVKGARKGIRDDEGNVRTGGNLW